MNRRSLFGFLALAPAAAAVRTLPSPAPVAEVPSSTITLVRGGHLFAGTISGRQIVAGAITAEKLYFSSVPRREV